MTRVMLTLAVAVAALPGQRFEESYVIEPPRVAVSPLFVRLPAPSKLPVWQVWSDGRPVGRAQLMPDGRRVAVILNKPPRAAKLVLGGLNGGRSRSASIIDEADGGLLVRNPRGRLFSFACTDRLRPGIDPKWARSVYVHPVWIGGVDVLDDFPSDHLHHRGISWTWPVVEVSGKRYDLWTLDGCRQRVDEVVSRTSGDVYTKIVLESGWHAGGKKIVDERIEITAWTGTADARLATGLLLDFDLTWTAAGAPVRLAGQPTQDKGYGGFGVRLAPRKDARITTSSGPLEKDTLHARYGWVDYSARFRGSEKRMGVTVMSHPANDGHPSEWLVRHYGWVGESWPGLAGTTLEADKPVRRRYRVWFHRGSLSLSRCSLLHATFSEPMTLDVEKK